MAVVEIVKYEGNPEVFAWKFPNTQLGTWTQLIVNESQEAILVKGGQVCDVFGPGRHVLDTNNIPILNKIINLPFGGRTPFSAEIWFINKTFSLDVKWGTSTPIQLQDPKYKVFVPVRAFGQFGIKIEESKKFLIKLVGTLPTFNKDTILKYFRGVYLTKAKDVISSYLIHKNISILEINAYLDEISTYLQEKIAPFLEEYGIKLISFFVNDINVPENDTAVVQLKKALAKKAEMEIVGYNYQQERSFDTLEGAATNSNSMQGSLMGAGLGLGMGVGMSGTFKNQFGGVAQEINTSSMKECSKCKSKVDVNAKYCNSCGADMNSNAKRCPKCNNVLGDNAKFCGECGYSLVKKCKSCDAIIENNVKFCPTCGTKVEEEEKAHEEK